MKLIKVKVSKKIDDITGLDFAIFGKEMCNQFKAIFGNPSDFRTFAQGSKFIGCSFGNRDKEPNKPNASFGATLKGKKVQVTVEVNIGELYKTNRLLDKKESYKDIPSAKDGCIKLFKEAKDICKKNS